MGKGSSFLGSFFLFEDVFPESTQKNQGTIFFSLYRTFVGFHPFKASQSKIFPSPSKKRRRGHYDRWNPTAFGVQACAAVLQAGMVLLVGRELRKEIGTP